MASSLLEPPLVDAGHREPPRPPRTGGGGNGDGNADDAARRRQPPHVAVFGMFVLLVPIFVLFMAFVSAYVVRLSFGETLRTSPIPKLVWFNGGLLLASSVVLERARRIVNAGGRGKNWFLSTVTLGVLFMIGQLLVWWQLQARGFDISSTPHASFFYLLSGVHLFHLLGGLAGLLMAAYWPKRRWQATPLAVVARVNAIYWHFLGALWLGLLLLLMLWK